MHRDRELFVNVASMDVDSAEKATHDAWVNRLADSLGKNGTGGDVGFMGEAIRRPSARPTQAPPGIGSGS